VGTLKGKKAVSLLLAALFLSTLLLSAGWGAEKKVLFIVASQNFRDEELFVPRDAFLKAGYKAVIASSRLGILSGMLGGTASATLSLPQVKTADYSAIVFVGGPGAQEFFDDKDAHRIAREAVKEKKVLGAICLAPVTLARAGVLKGAKATVWYSEGGKLEKAGASYTPDRVVRSGLIVTACGPEAAPEFARTLLNALQGR